MYQKQRHRSLIKRSTLVRESGARRAPSQPRYASRPSYNDYGGGGEHTYVGDPESPYLDDDTGEFAEDLDSGVPEVTNAASSGVLSAIIIVMVLALAFGYGIWIRSVSDEVNVLEKLVVFNPYIPFLNVYIDPLNGDDSSGKGTLLNPYRTFQPAFDKISKCTGSRATIWLISDGSVCGLAGALDLGTNTSLNFFPLTAQYAEIVIRGQRQNVANTTIAGINALPGTQGYTQLVTAMGGLVPDVYQNNFLDHLNDDRRYVIEDNTVNALDVVGGNSQDESPIVGQASPIAFEIGDAIQAYTVCNALTWQGNLHLNYSYNRVYFEDLWLIPADTQSVWVNPPLRQDAVAFRGVRMDVLGSVETSLNTDIGLPILATIDPSYRGSMALEGVYINGSAVDNAAFNTLADTVCARMHSVRSVEASLFFSDTCSAFFVSVTRSAEMGDLITVSSGDFRGHGLKLRTDAGPSLHAMPRGIRLSAGTTAQLTHVDIEGDLDRGIDVDGAANAILENVTIALDNATVGFTNQAAVFVGDAVSLALRNVDLSAAQCVYARGTSQVSVWEEFACVPRDHVALWLSRGARMDFEPVDSTSGPPDSTIDQTSNNPIVLVERGSSLNLGRPGTSYDWTTPDQVPLIRLRTESQLSYGDSPTALANGNANNAAYILQVGSNNPTPFYTQDDYINNDSERCQALANDMPQTLEVWVDGTSGDNAQPGTAAWPLQTLDQAIAVLGQRSQNALSCVIHIVGTLDLGADPTICTTPLEKACKHVTIQGAEGNVVNDVVASINDIDPTSRNWKGVTGLTGGYSVNAYQTYFVRNNAQDRVYTVDSNTANAVVSIVGPANRGQGTGTLPPSLLEPQPWTIMDSFTLFTISSTLTWTGGLSLDIPYNQLVFASLIMAPSTADSYVVAPDGQDFRIVFRGCHLEAWSDDSTKPSYQGTMLIQGCYGDGQVANAAFCGDQNDRRIIFDSFWSNAATVRMTGDCSLLNFKSSASPSTAVTIDGGAAFRGSNIYIDEPAASGAIAMNEGASFTLEYVKIESTSATVNTAIQVTQGSSGFLAYFDISCTGVNCIALACHSDASISVSSDGVIEAPQPISILRSSHVGITSSTFTMTGMTTTAIVVDDGSTFRVEPTTLTVDMSAIAFSVVSASDGSSVVLEGTNTGYVLSTQNNVPLFAVSAGSSIINSVTGTITNGGGNAAHVVKCGEHVIAPFTVTEQDLTTNCFCTVAGPSGTLPDPVASRTIYVNAASGSDNNRGATSAEALATIPYAMTVLAQQPAFQCIMQLEGATAFDLGVDPRLNFQNLQRACQYISVRGTETAVVAGTIDAPITVFNSDGRAWDIITDSGAAWTPAAFDTLFIRNEAQDRVYVIETNDATTIRTIAGPSVYGINFQSLPPTTAVESVAWTNGDAFTVFSVSTQITWTGSFIVDVTSKEVSFESVFMNPGADGSTFHASDGFDAHVWFKGCNLASRSASSMDASYQGSMVLRGVYGTASIVGAYFVGLQQGRTVYAESLWVDSCYMAFTDTNSLAYFKTSTSPGVGLYVSGASSFRLSRGFVENSGDTPIVIDGASIASFDYLSISIAGGATTTAAQSILVDDNSQVQMGTMGATCSAASCLRTFYVRKGAYLRITGNFYSNCDSALLLETAATMLIEGNPGYSLPSFTGTPYVVRSGGSLTIDPGNAFNLNLPVAGSIVDCAGGFLTMLGTNSDYNLGTLSGNPIVLASQGALVRGLFTGGTLTNVGDVGTEVLLCGGSPSITTWTNAENDFALAPGTTQGCNCAR